MSFRIAIEERPGEGVRRIAAERTRSAMRDVANAEEPVEWRVHQVRKRCKQVRALVRLVRTGFPDYRRVNKSFRDTARVLTSHRDARVMANLVRELAKHVEPKKKPKHNPVVQWFEFHADSAEELVEPALLRVEQMLADAAVDIESWPVDTIRIDDAIEGLWQTLAAVYATTAAVRDGGPLHEWRKRCKDHWYQLRILRNVLPEGKKDRVQGFDDLGEFVGDAHDRIVLTDRLENLPDYLGNTPEAKSIEVAALQEQRELTTKALALCDELLAGSPEDFIDSVSRNWRGSGNSGNNDEPAIRLAAPLKP